MANPIPVYRYFTQSMAAFAKLVFLDFAKPVRVITASSTLLITDQDAIIESSAAGAINFTIAPNDQVKWPIGKSFELRTSGAGQVTIVPGTGVTVNSRGGMLKTNGQWAVIKATKRGTNLWILEGDRAV